MKIKKKLIQYYIDKTSQTKTDFTDKFNCNLISKFNDFRHKGLVELLATCGTDVFIPHYFEYPEVISAQIETGLHAYRQCFGEIPDGFWIPELGYTNGLEKLIRADGYSYTILSARSFLLANDKLEKGIFYPARTDNSLVFFQMTRKLMIYFTATRDTQQKIFIETKIKTLDLLILLKALPH